MTVNLPRKLKGGTAWLGLARGGVRLDDGTVVISPHLDDAVFSLGAAMARAARAGARITVLTVLAGDPGSAAAAGDWDRDSGFATAGEAAAARREEDRRACSLLGVAPVWLEFADLQYERGGDERSIRAAIVSGTAGARAVLVPGFPLMHPDHAWLAGMLDGADFGPARVGRYVEQPYAALWHDGPPPDDSWARAQASLRDRLAKARAWRAYRSQLGQIGSGALTRVVRYEGGRGGEAVVWDT